MSKWQPESIPDSDRLFMRIHKTWIRGQDVLPGAFQNRPQGATGMSTDWEKYSSPASTQLRAQRPAEQAVVALLAGEVRSLPAQVVDHTPQDDNRAHTDIVGAKDEEVRLKFTRLFTWALKLAPKG
jgi:hypothetical protein